MTGADGRRYSIPGDYATVEPDGTITLLGRGSVCINTGGEKVYPEEVEQALKAHPKVFDAIVVGVTDERWGQKVAAVVQARSGEEPSLDELDARLPVGGRRLQGPPGAAPRRRDPALTVGQARLPVGEEARRRRRQHLGLSGT